MMQLEFGGKRYPIAAGETVIGTAPGCAVPLTGDEVQPRHAVLHGSPAGAAIRAAVPEAGVLVNGVPLGSDPTPLLHGDKIQIGGHELLAVDPGRGGRTQFMSVSSDDDMEGVASGPRDEAPARRPSGGRLVSLTDGREYRVGEQLVLGRDAGADVVIMGHEVSRRHAEILWTGDGYQVADASVNGTYVNGVKVDRTCPLARADVIRIGSEEFRFHADAPATPLPATPLPVAGTAPAGAAYRLSDTLYGQVTAPAVPLAPPPLASLLVRSGDRKGQRLAIAAAVANVGRADYNDVVLADPSVSAQHAKLQRRDGLWILTDSGSTNGTYADGELVTDEMPLLPGASLRFGEVTVLFEPHDDAVEAAATTVGGTQVVERIEAAPAFVPVAASAPPPVVVPVSSPAVIEPPVVVDERVTVEPVAATDDAIQPEDVTMPTPARRPLRSPRPAPEARPDMPWWLLVAIMLAAGAAGIAVGFVLLR